MLFPAARETTVNIGLITIKIGSAIDDEQAEAFVKMFKDGGCKKMMRQMEAMSGKGGMPPFR